MLIIDKTFLRNDIFKKVKYMIQCFKFVKYVDLCFQK